MFFCLDTCKTLLLLTNHTIHISQVCRANINNHTKIYIFFIYRIYLHSTFWYRVDTIHQETKRMLKNRENQKLFLVRGMLNFLYLSSFFTQLIFFFFFKSTCILEPEVEFKNLTNILKIVKNSKKEEEEESTSVSNNLRKVIHQHLPVFFLIIFFFISFLRFGRDENAH